MKKRIRRLWRHRYDVKPYIKRRVTRAAFRLRYPHGCPGTFRGRPCTRQDFVHIKRGFHWSPGLGIAKVPTTPTCDCGARFHEQPSARDAELVLREHSCPTTPPPPPPPYYRYARYCDGWVQVDELGDVCGTELRLGGECPNAHNHVAPSTGWRAQRSPRD